MSPKAKSADFRTLSPNDQVRRLQQCAAEGRREVLHQLQLRSEIVGPAKRLVDNLVGSARTVQFTVRGVATRRLLRHTHRGFLCQLSLTLRTLKLRAADGAVDGEGVLAVMNVSLHWGTRDTGVHRALHRCARCCDCVQEAVST